MCSEDKPFVDMEQITTKVQKFCTANGGKGYVGLYFTQKELRQLKRLGIGEGMTIREAFERIK